MIKRAAASLSGRSTAPATSTGHISRIVLGTTGFPSSVAASLFRTQGTGGEVVTQPDQRETRTTDTNSSVPNNPSFATPFVTNSYNMYRHWKKEKFGEDVLLYAPQMMVSVDDIPWAKERMAAKSKPIKATTTISIEGLDNDQNSTNGHRGAISLDFHVNVSYDPNGKPPAPRGKTAPETDPDVTIQRESSTLNEVVISRPGSAAESIKSSRSVTVETERRDSVRSLPNKDRRESTRSRQPSIGRKESVDRRESTRSVQNLGDRRHSTRKASVRSIRTNQSPIPRISPIPLSPTPPRPPTQPNSRRGSKRISIAPCNGELVKISANEKTQHSLGILSCAVSEDQNVCITGSGDKEGEKATIRAWNPSTGEPIGGSQELCRRITGISISTKFAIMAWSSGEGAIINLLEISNFSKEINTQVMEMIVLPQGNINDDSDKLLCGWTPLNGSSDGNYLVAISTKRTSIFIIDMNDKQVEEIPDVHKGAVLGGCFSPDSKHLVTWCSAYSNPFKESAEPDAPSEIKLLEVDSKKELCSVEVDRDDCIPQPGWENKAGFANVVYHPSQPIIACTTHNGKLQLRKSINLEIKKEVMAHNSSTPALRFSKDGQYVITGSQDGCIKVWSFPELKDIATYDVGAEVTCLDTFESEHGNLVINCGDNRGIMLVLEFKPQTNGPRRTSQAPRKASFAPTDSRRPSQALNPDRRASVRSQSRKPSQVESEMFPIPPAGSNSRPESAMNEGGERTMILVWKNEDVTDKHDVGILSCALSFDEEICVTGSGGDEGVAGNIQAWNPLSGNSLGVSKALAKKITGLSFSPRYPLLACGTGNGKEVICFELRQTDTGVLETVTVLQVKLQTSTDDSDDKAEDGHDELAASADGKYLLVTSTLKNSVYIITMSSGLYEELKNVHVGAVCGGCFSSDGDKFITWCSAYTQPYGSVTEPDTDSELKLFDTELQTEICSIQAAGQEAAPDSSSSENKAGFAAVRFHPNEDFVACTSHSGLLQTRDSKTLEVKGEVTAHERSIPALKFSPDGNHIVTGSLDGWLRVWSFPDLQQITEYMVGNEVTCLTTLLSPDKTLVINCGDNTGKFYVFEMQETDQPGQT